MTSAPLFQRTIAYLIDGFALLSIRFIVWTIAGALMQFITFSETSTIYNNLPSQQTFALIDPYLRILIPMIYFPLFESSTYQATPGKRIFELRITSTRGQRVTVIKSFFRLVVSVLSVLTIVGILIIPFTKRKQALHDMICGTVVVKAEPKGKA